MPDKDRTGPRQRSRYPSKPMGGLRRGECIDKDEKEDNIVSKILNKIIGKK